MLLALWADFWTSSDWIPPAMADYWCALTSQSGYTGGADIEEL